MDETSIDPNVLRRFQVLEIVGRGAYGIVWKAMDRKTRSIVALKKCFDAFRNATDAQRTFREVMYLRALAGHDHIVRLHQVIASHHQTDSTTITTSSTSSNSDLYLTFEYMDTDLGTAIRAGILTDLHQRFIIWQILKALLYVHSAGLVHRDLKPGNILLSADCRVKLCDFGLCRSSMTTKNLTSTRNVMTDYIATRWYRSPEILVGSIHYMCSADIWALGAILGEMCIGRPVFPGTSTMNQLDRIVRLVGVPTRDDLNSLDSPFASEMIEALPPVFAPPPNIPPPSDRKIYSTNDDYYMNESHNGDGTGNDSESETSFGLHTGKHTPFQRPNQDYKSDAKSTFDHSTNTKMTSTEFSSSNNHTNTPKTSQQLRWEKVFPNVSSECLNFIRLCLRFNPLKRPNVEDLLRHAYVQEFRQASKDYYHKHHQDNINSSYDDEHRDEKKFNGGPIKLSLPDDEQYDQDVYRECLYREMEQQQQRNISNSQ